ncbi:MAG: hypothetical protein ACK2TV_06035, partial [Anaerolineales bacterium]
MKGKTMSDEWQSENEELDSENLEENIPEPSPKVSDANTSENLKTISEISQEDLTDAKKRVDSSASETPQPASPFYTPL